MSGMSERLSLGRRRGRRAVRMLKRRMRVSERRRGVVRALRVEWARRLEIGELIASVS